MNRKKIVIANWKMYKNNQETKNFINIFTAKIMNKKVNCDYGIAASFTNLPVLQTINLENFLITAQNCSDKLEGAFTGEISLMMLKDFRVSYVIIGHSERRILFNETDELINKKLLAITNHSNLKAILCCGETVNEFEANKTMFVIEKQITKALNGLTTAAVAKMVIAYEPIWAIGSGKHASTHLAQTVCKGIRAIISNLYNQKIADQVRIQYGGSVNVNNIKEFLTQPDIDGVLVGSASLQPDTFVNLILAV